MKGIGFYDRDFFVIKTDYELIAESITRIVMTNPGERPGLPFFGVGLKNRVFEPLDDVISKEIEADIRIQIESFEPRAILLSINFEKIEVENTLDVKIGFVVRGDKVEDERFINLVFELGE